ncbi:alpha/beta hydrolase [Halioglobus maricola]|uniref:Alpha/beta hydrolase n=1 Tax=Halioglobus maricola TaxID=2601894 RepID=A0A5P9NHH3_9GAMM|nr:alpha/beta hydrolase [Halioglobus maricola]QFU75277.1 alpha/beta hydrolase [Halioglobus maricola]
METREYHLDIGDVELAVTEWPGSGHPVLLLHATGFHSRCWNQVVSRLPGQHIYAVDLRHHGRSGSIGEVDWNVLSEDIIKLVRRLDLSNVIGVGHSIGGYLIARAAAALPDHFREILLIDPVITAPETYKVAQEFSASFSAKDHPVSRRKNQWQDANEMFSRFANKEPFSTWDRDVLRDYCDYALHPESEEEYRQLACDPLNEASVYVSQAYSDAVLEDLPKLRLPITLLRAEYKGIDLTDLAGSPTWPELAQSLANCEEVYLPEMNHFIPMQDPALVAEHIAKALGK